MSTREDIKAFLTSRRARITPEQIGLPAANANRRVPGLRRQEVAVLASISLEYYTRIERGQATGVSESVLDGIAAALRLSDDERAHLIDLLRTVGSTRPRRPRPVPDRVRPSVIRLVDALVGSPACVHNRRLDILYANPLGRALYDPMYADPVRPANFARFLFLDRGAETYWGEWDTRADNTVAILRASAGRDPYDRGLSDLIGELSTRSEQFRVRWAAHDVQHHRATRMHIRHPVVGDLTLQKEVLTLEDGGGQTVAAYTAEPQSPSRQALDLLASWGTVPDATGVSDH